MREAAQAFNAMQDRIRHGIEERERFLAAVSHDLKTPVTRMRLRSELTDANLRERTLRDLDEMQQMLGGALDFLRGKAADEAQRPIDMLALLESLVDDRPNSARHPPGRVRRCRALLSAGRRPCAAPSATWSRTR
ncbi:MAG: hypothetical protein IPN05_09515 [Sulfuritalea sp.]|nr:hypothetical protein [Sulfuritalea sp.]